MKFRALFMSAIVTMAGSFPATSWGEEVNAPAQLTLKQAVNMAIEQSELLQMTSEDIIQARTRVKRSIAAILPNIGWNWNEIIQDTSGTSSEGGVGGTLTKKSRTESRFIGRQPIFSGFKEFSAYAGYKAEVRGREHQLTREQIDLFGATAEAFFLVVLLETERQDLLTIIKLSQDRVSELSGRTNLGKSRQSEVISAESQLASLKAQEVATEGQILAARETLGFLVGEDISYTFLLDTTPRPVPVADEKEMLLLIKDRSDIQALQEKVIARRYGVKVARSGYWPRADVVGNYYTKRTGFQEPIDWDVTFNVDVPLFQGGGVMAQAEEAKSLLRQAELELERLTRNVATEIRRARTNLNYSISEAELLEKAYLNAKRSYEIQSKEYRLGLVTNLDVLAALNVMQDAKQRSDRGILQSKLNWFRLQLALEQPI